MKDLIEELFPLRRDLVSDGYDKALDIISDNIPLNILEVPSGTKCFNWILPDKWSVKEAYVKNTSGDRIIDARDNPLHIASYSNAVEKIISREELINHLKTYPDRPDLIPFGYCYYDDDWQFCIKDNCLDEINRGEFKVKIESKHEPGKLKVGETTIPGDSSETIVLVSHLCHPYQANDDLSGVSVLVKIANDLLDRNDLHYTYKFLFVPETIGSIAYLSQREDRLDNYRYGIFLEMLGHDDQFSLQYSYYGNTRIDRIAEYILDESNKAFRTGAFGRIVSNDETVFNATGIEIPMISLSRADYLENGPYYQYHSHKDSPEIINETNLKEAKNITLRIIDVLENDFVPEQKYRGIPQLSRNDLWIDWTDPEKQELFQKIVHEALYRLDGSESVFDISEALALDFEFFKNYLDKMKEAGLLETREVEDLSEID